MDEVIDTDSLATRRLILEEFEKVQEHIATNPELWRKLSFEGHEKLCKVMGADFIDYPEFEFWFLRFVQGNLELDYDRSSDPKTRSFTDLPLEIFENVGEYLELHDRLKLRDVCKDFRAHVDNWDLKVAMLWYLSANHWQFHQSGREPYRPWSRSRSIELDEDYRFSPRNPISFVMNVLKHPKLRLEKLEIDQQDDYWKEFIKELDESNQKLHVKKVEFGYNHLSKIDLHFMVPGVLEEIKLFIENPKRKEIIEIVESEQCQSAKMVHIKSPTVTSRFPLDALYNCPRFSLQLDGSADGLKAAFLKKLMKKGKVEKCVLYADSQIMKYFNEPKAMVPNFPSLRRYPIPETNDFYEIEYQGDAVRLERKQ